MRLKGLAWVKPEGLVRMAAPDEISSILSAMRAFCAFAFPFFATELEGLALHMQSTVI